MRRGAGLKLGAVLGGVVVVVAAVWVGHDLGTSSAAGRSGPSSGPATTGTRTHGAQPTPSTRPSATDRTAPRTRDKVVVLDSGHSAGSAAVIDPRTGLVDRYYPNYPELNDVYAVALLVKQKLLAHGGFRVLLTKRTAGQDATYRQRAEVANLNHADLGVSIHDQGGLPAQGGLPFASRNNLVYDQAVGMYAQPRDSAGRDIGRRTTFTDARVAALSRRYAQVFVAQRSAAEGHPVQLTFGRSEARDVNDADIWLVQLFSKVPWIYNEAGGYSPASTHCGVDGSGAPIPDGACLSTADKQRYATGIANAVIAALLP